MARFIPGASHLFLGRAGLLVVIVSLFLARRSRNIANQLKNPLDQ